MPGCESAARRILESAVAAGCWARPFLLLGPPGDERDGAAEAFARAVLCTGRGGLGKACGACGSCHRSSRDLHPDLHRLLPEKGRATVGVDAVEALQARLALRPVEGRGRAVLVPDAERLTDPAQNALLKTLEEPPPATALVLAAAAPRALLPTVRSRCATVRFPPATPDAMERRAAEGGAVPAAAAAAAVAAEGDPALLEAALAEGLEEALPGIAASLAPAPRSRDPLEGLEGVVGWVRGGGGRLEDQRRRLRMALRVLLALHRPGAGGLPLPADLGRGYDDLPSPARRDRLAALGEAREQVERNVDPAGILEALAVRAREADRRGRGRTAPG